ncbi:MAG: helix-turn-helix transcriptional regulator [Alphaproteobacteria bacterium]
MSQNTLISRQNLKLKGIKFTNTHLSNLEKEGKFPKRIFVGRRTVAWIESEIDAWLAQRMQAREEA